MPFFTHWIIPHKIFKSATNAQRKYLFSHQLSSQPDDSIIRFKTRRWPTFELFYRIVRLTTQRVGKLIFYHSIIYSDINMSNYWYIMMFSLYITHVDCEALIQKVLILRMYKLGCSLSQNDFNSLKAKNRINSLKVKLVQRFRWKLIISKTILTEFNFR